MINKYSKKLVSCLLSLSDSKADNDQTEVYIYGMECFLNTAITLLILMVWAFATHSLISVSCWLIWFSFMRKYCGGYHAPTQYSCIISSSLLGISCSLYSKITSLPWYLDPVVYIFIFIVVILFAPVRSQKIILTQRKVIRNKVISVLLAFGSFLLSCFMDNTISRSLTYACLSTAVLIMLSVIKTTLQAKLA